MQGPTAADYERRDTIASLSMGVASLFAPLVVPKLLAPITPGKGRHGKKLLAVAAGAIALTTAADVIARRGEDAPAPERRRGAALESPPRRPLGSPNRQRGWCRRSRDRRCRAVTTTLVTRTKVDGFWRRGKERDLGTGVPALLAATLAWDFIYYWNHRFMHESRYMWAVHVVHHSSERYNLSTALRQPVADAFGTFLPYSALAFVGIRPELIQSARGINLLYQYWIHTDTIRRLGPFESVLNTPSHHRVHHGSNGQYIDRNHGSILIVWDRLFGTYEREGEPVVYGLTKNIETFNPARIAAHEHKDMLLDVAQSRTWRERLSYVVRGPGWAYARHKERAGGEAAHS